MTTQYATQEWNEYAPAHLTATAAMQLVLNKAVAQNLKGIVADFGCGTALIAQILAQNPDVYRYVGIDQADDMVRQAKRRINKLAKPSYRVLHNTIQDAIFEPADYGISINSAYAWDDLERNLAAIYKHILPGGKFIIATPNPKMDMPKLLEAAKAELLMHPDFDQFYQINLALADHPAKDFMPMHDLVAHCHAAGFRLDNCNQEHYLGGLNYAEFIRP